MVMVVQLTLTASTSLPPLPSFKPPPQQLFLTTRPTTHYFRKYPPRATQISATSNGLFVLSEAKQAINTEQIVTTASENGDGVSIVISVLLSVAFVGLSVLTIGVIYIAVTDYLQKREKEKFEKEEAEKAKRGGKKKRVRPRVGPKGFGAKIDNDDDL